MLNFTESLNFEEYLEKQHEQYGTTTDDAYKNTKLSAKAKESIKAVDETTHVAVFAEGRCGDCVLTVPFIERIAEENHNIKLHFFPKDGFEDYLEKTVGYKKIPTVIAFNKDLTIKDTYIEFPKEIREKADSLSEVDRKNFVLKIRDGEFNELIEDELIKTLL